MQLPVELPVGASTISVRLSARLNGCRRPLSVHARGPNYTRTLKVANAATPESHTLITDSESNADKRAARSTLAALDLVLGSSDDESVAVQDDSKPELWWTVLPSQSSPPRRSAMRGGTVSRFFIGDALVKSELRTGRLTAVGEELDVPTVQPGISLVLAISQLVIHVFGIYISVSQGSASAQDYLSGLALAPAGAGDLQGYQFLSSALLQSSSLQLLASCLGLCAVGLEVESLLGYSSVLLVYALVSSSAIVASGIINSNTAWAIAPAATLGLLTSFLGYSLRNPEMPSSNNLLGKVAVLGGLALAAPYGSALLGFEPLGQGLPGLEAGEQLALLLTGAVSGILLGYLLGPRFHITREVEIPEGSMIIPDDAEEKVVVVDETLLVSKLAMAGAIAAALWLGSSVLGN